MTLTLQKFKSASGWSNDYYFSFVGQEINRLLEFIRNIQIVIFDNENKINITDDELNSIILNQRQVTKLFTENEGILVKFAQNEFVKRDIVALGYRRAQLAKFEQLLIDQSFFESEKLRIGGQSPEQVWQEFFEANKWIFGYGLSYIF